MPGQVTLTTSNFHESPYSKRRQIAELIDIMSPREVPFIKLIGIDGEAGSNPKHEWLEDTLLAETSLVHDNPLLIGALNVTVPAGHGINFQVGNLIKVASEFMYVTQVVVDALTVIRGAAGSAAAQHAQNTVIEIVGIANKEGSDAPLKGTTELVIPYNYFQDFDQAYSISYVAEKTAIHGVQEGDYARELKKAFEEITIKLERTAILGVRFAGDPNVPRLMGGLDYFLSSAYSTNHASIDLGGAPVEEKDINDLLQKLFYAVGSQNMARTVICGAWNKRRVNDFYAPSARMARNERTGGVVVDTIDTDHGPVDVVISLRCPMNKMYFVNTEFLKIHPYNGLAFFDEEKSTQGAYKKREIFGSYSMTAKNTKSMGVILNTAIA